MAAAVLLKPVTPIALLNVAVLRTYFPQIIRGEPLTHSGEQGKDGVQLKGPSGQPSALRLRINYGPVGPSGAIRGGPPAAATVPARPGGPARPVPAEIKLPPGWEQKTDPSGKIFYVNHQLKTFSWTPPPLLAGTPPPVAGAAAGGPRAGSGQDSVPASAGPSPRGRDDPPRPSPPEAAPSPSRASAAAPSAQPQPPAAKMPPAAEVAGPSPRAGPTASSVTTPARLGGHAALSAAPAAAPSPPAAAKIVPPTAAAPPPPAAPVPPREPRAGAAWRLAGAVVAGRDLPRFGAGPASPFVCLSLLAGADAMDPKQRDRVDHLVLPGAGGGGSGGADGSTFTSKGRICRIDPQAVEDVIRYYVIACYVKIRGKRWKGRICRLEPQAVLAPGCCDWRLPP